MKFIAELVLACLDDIGIGKQVDAIRLLPLWNKA